MIFFRIVIVFLLLAGCVFGPVGNFSDKDIKNSQNEIYNSSFELTAENSKNILQGWTLIDDSTAEIALTNQEFNQGKLSLKIANPGKKISLISDSFSIDPQSIYYNQISFKTNYKSNHPVKFMFVAFDAAGKKINTFKTKCYPDDIWTKCDLTTGYFKPKARFARIIITIPARKDKIFWVDDVESYKIYKIQK